MSIDPERPIKIEALDPAENLEKLKEENEALTAKKHIHGQKELEDKERASGPLMAWQEVIRRVRKKNTALKVVDGNAGCVALFVPKTNSEMEGFRWDETRNELGNTHRYCGGFPKEPMAEYAYVVTDNVGLVKREVRGWRSVLIALIKAGVIRYSDAIKEFGEATGTRSDRWNEQLRQEK